MNEPDFQTQLDLLAIELFELRQTLRGMLKELGKEEVE